MTLHLNYYINTVYDVKRSVYLFMSVWVTSFLASSPKHYFSIFKVAFSICSIHLFDLAHSRRHKAPLSAPPCCEEGASGPTMGLTLRSSFIGTLKRNNSAALVPFSLQIIVLENGVRTFKSDFRGSTLCSLFRVRLS